MSNTLRGMVAGFVATLVLGAVLLLKGSLELWPELNIIRLLSSLGGLTTAAAWMDHFIVGTVVWGLLFSIFDPLGASYPHIGGKNVSSLHWDLIKDLREGGRIELDGEVVQENGTWVI